ncbi:hypothetical protein Q3G72_019063 [Acer saccharum]|nr:hypothetical protein Q3G72_019063 [Acer saccharum]
MGSDDHDHGKISHNYMILRPEEVSLCDLIGILVSSDIACKAFVKIPTGKEENIKDRGIMFMSLLGQKLLQSFSVPISKLGSALEMWLNILSSNGNLSLLLLHVLQDYQRKATTQGFMFHDKISDPDTIIIAFRGTETFDADAWCTDIDLSWYEFDMGKIHGGFMKALGLVINQGWPKEYEQESKKPLAYYTLREELKKFLKQNSRTKFILTGHSQGGALAILFPAVLAFHEETQLLERLEGVLPHDDSTFLFKHFGTCLYYNSCYRGEIVEEEPDKNYILQAMIPRILISWWELLRSFMMPYMEGPDFVETGLLKFARFVGLVFPSFASHSPQDYVNLTRLGFPDDILIQASRKVYGN